MNKIFEPVIIIPVITIILLSVVPNGSMLQNVLQVVVGLPLLVLWTGFGLLSLGRTIVLILFIIAIPFNALIDNSWS